MSVKTYNFFVVGKKALADPFLVTKASKINHFSIEVNKKSPKKPKISPKIRILLPTFHIKRTADYKTQTIFE